MKPANGFSYHHDPVNWNYDDGTPEGGMPTEFETEFDDDDTDYDIRPDNDHRCPCDDGYCPYLDSEGTNQSYFCREMCGVGVDD